MEAPSIGLEPLIGVLAFLIGAVLWFLRQSAKAKKARRENAIRDKKKIDEEVENLSPADLDREFERWMRDR